MVVKLNILEDEPMEELKQTKNARNKVKTAIYFTAVSVCVVGSICILACWQKIQSPGDYMFSDIGELDNGKTRKIAYRTRSLRVVFTSFICAIKRNFGTSELCYELKLGGR